MNNDNENIEQILIREVVEDFEIGSRAAIRQMRGSLE